VKNETLLACHLAGPDLLGSGSSGSGPVVPDRRIDVYLGNPGGCPHEKVIYFNVFDNSGSVTGGNDPIGRRFQEVAYTLEHLSRFCHCGREFSSIIHFDTPTSGDVPPTKLNRKGLDALDGGLAIPLDGAGISELGPSLRRVTDVVAKNPDFTPVVTVLSDFELFDPPQVLHDLVSFPGIVHAVVLRSEPPELLVDDDRVRVTRVLPSAPSGAVAKAVFESMTALRKTPRSFKFRRKEAPSW
jgi:hypothetical protein